MERKTPKFGISIGIALAIGIRVTKPTAIADSYPDTDSDAFHALGCAPPAHEILPQNS
jgi:hypothetical protein